MLNPAKAPVTALLNAAKRLLGKQEYADAELYLLEVLNRGVNDHTALSRLGEVYIAQGRLQDAVAYYAAAIRANPTELSYKERFIELGGNLHVTRYDALVDLAIVECLKTADLLDCTAMRFFWVTHLTSEPTFHATFKLADLQSFDPANKKFFEDLQDFKPLFTPTFLLGIRHIVGGSPVFEEFIKHLRKHLLEDEFRDIKKFTSEESLSLSIAIAYYSFNTDYILDCTVEEQENVDALRTRIENTGSASGDAAYIALLACYVPLYKLKNAANIAREYSSACREIRALLNTQIVDYDELQIAAATVTAITTIDDPVSSQVRKQYEEFPYPRWTRISKQSRASGWKTRQEKFAGGLHDKKIKILCAGCGTGQEAIVLASVFPKARILAVDLSRTSLAYAIKKAEEHSVKNVTFRQADILSLGQPGEEFDFINSMGVLHHMQDPVKGWNVLCDLLKPGGHMMIGLYSKIARRAVLYTQEVIKRGGYTADTGSMKAFRRDSPQLLEKDVLNDITGYSDYFFMSTYCDLLFHVQEYDYDLPEIEDVLNRLNLDFAGFSLDYPVLAEYGKQYPNDSEMINLKNWHAFEERNPNIFREMYYLWCRKSR